MTMTHAPASTPLDPRLTDPRLLPEAPALLDHLLALIPAAIHGGQPEDRAVLRLTLVQMARMAQRGVPGTTEAARLLAAYFAGEVS